MTTGRSQAPTTSCPGCSRGRSRRDVTRGPADVRGVSQPPGRAESRGGRPVSSWGPTHRERSRTASRAESAWLARVRLVVNGGVQRQCRGLPAPGRSRREHPSRHGGRAQWVCLPRCPHGNQVPGRCQDVANHWSLRGGRWLRVGVEKSHAPLPEGTPCFLGSQVFPQRSRPFRSLALKPVTPGLPAFCSFPGETILSGGGVHEAGQASSPRALRPAPWHPQPYSGALRAARLTSSLSAASGSFSPSLPFLEFSFVLFSLSEGGGRRRRQRG